MPAHEPKLAISGYIYPDSCTVIVSVSENTFPKSFGPIHMIVDDHMKVTLYEDGVFYDSLRPYSKHVVGINAMDSIQNGYVSMKKAKPGATYRIEVTYPGYPTVSAETTVPLPVSIISAETDFVPTVDHSLIYPEVIFYSIIRILNFNFVDPAGQNNYYLLNLFAKESSAPADSNYSMNLENCLLFEHIETGDANDIDYFGNANTRLFSDVYFNGSAYQFRYRYGTMSDPDKPSYIPDYVIDDLNRNSDSLNILSYGYSPTWISYVPDEVTVRLYTISEEYYKYNRSKLKYMEAEQDPNSEPVILYSNVTGGYGIFAGISYSEYTYTFAK